MAQVVLDVLYNVKGMQALKASQQAMTGAANAAQAGTNKIRGYNAATDKTALAAGKAAAGNKVAANSYRATGFAAVGATGGVKSFGVALSAALGPIAAITGGLALLGKAVNVVGDRERDVALLTNGLKNLGLQGTPALDALQRSADKLGKTTLFDQEQFTRGFALLTSFKTIGVSSYERVATAAADLAQTTGQDLNTALLQLSKALEDPARRVTDLSRSGTVFTEQQKEQIKVLQASGNMLGAQNLILEEIERQYGNAAVAAGEAGFAGAMDSLGEATRDFMETGGKGMVVALSDLINLFTDLITIADNFVQKLEEIGVNKVFDALMTPARIFGELVSDSADSIDKTREAAEGATPAVSELKDQAMNLPDPVQKAGEKMDELKTKTGAAKGEAGQLKAQLDQAPMSVERTNQAMQQTEEQIRRQSYAQQDVNQQISQGTTAADLMQQMEMLAAQNAQLLAQAQASANAKINQGAAAASNLANQLQRAASASASISGVSLGGGGGGGGGNATSQWTNAYKQINKSKLDQDGNIVQKSQQEIQREKNQHIVNGWKGGFLETRTGGADEFAAAAFDASWYAAGLGSKELASTANSVRQYGGMMGPKGSALYNEINQHRYAEGGYVTGPQQAIVGEGGEPEYIIPASKMDGAMQRYSAGMRGSSMIPSSADVTVNYSGSTVDMGGTSYINKGDVTGIVSQAVNQTLTKLQRSSKARLTAGLR